MISKSQTDFLPLVQDNKFLPPNSRWLQLTQEDISNLILSADVAKKESIINQDELI